MTVGAAAVPWQAREVESDRCYLRYIAAVLDPLAADSRGLARQLIWRKILTIAPASFPQCPFGTTILLLLNQDQAASWPAGKLVS